MTKQESINRFLVKAEDGIWYEWNPMIDLITKAQYNKIHPNPDFSKPENFIRLLKIAEKKHIGYEICNDYVAIIHEMKRHYLDCNADSTPSTLSELIAKALGWKEGE